MDDSSEPQQDESYDEAPFHGSLPPDHPMLQQAQDKLKEQLLATKQRLEEELRERQYAIKVLSPIKAAIHHEHSIWQGSILLRLTNRHVSHICSQRGPS